METLGRLLFLISLVIAFFAGFHYQQFDFSLILFFLGIIVGFLNITDKQATSFLVASIVLLFIGTSAIKFAYENAIVVNALSNILMIISGAVLVVALKQIIVLAKN